MAAGAPRRVVPYVLVAVIGFALAFLTVYFFILPEPGPEPSTVAADSQKKSLPVAEPPPVNEIMPEVTAPLPPDEPPPSAFPTTLPDLVGRDMWDAQQELDKLRLVIIIRRDTNSFELPNTVIRQTPQPGQRMFPNDTVVITISQFPPAR